MLTQIQSRAEFDFRRFAAELRADSDGMDRWEKCPHACAERRGSYIRLLHGTIKLYTTPFFF